MQTPNQKQAEPGSAPAYFSHVTRPPTLGFGENSWQRRFGGHDALFQSLSYPHAPNPSIEVFRDQTRDKAELIVSFIANHQTVAEMTAVLAANELVSLACALLDAAQDLRANPGAPRDAAS